jgi:predicted transposase YdaD
VRLARVPQRLRSALRIATRLVQENARFFQTALVRGLQTRALMNEAQHAEGNELGSLTQLRDEIRVRLHLAQLDAKDKWQELETQLASLEHRVASDGGSVLGATAQLAKDLKQSLVDFKDRLST